MGVEKTIIKNGNGTDFPKNGDDVAMEYTGWLFEPANDNKKGFKCVLSRTRSRCMTLR
jgi:FK506-binding protein 1